MKSVLSLAFVLAWVEVAAASQGVDAVVARRKEMKRVERPVAQRMQDGSILSVYADGRTATQSVAVATMRPSTRQAVERAVEDRKVLASARKLAASVKAKHGKKVAGLSDSEIVDSAEIVLDTSKSDAAVGGVIVAALAAAAASIAKARAKAKKEDGNV